MDKTERIKKHLIDIEFKLEDIQESMKAIEFILSEPEKEEKVEVKFNNSK